MDRLNNIEVLPYKNNFATCILDHDGYMKNVVSEVESPKTKANNYCQDYMCQNGILDKVSRHSTTLGRLMAFVLHLPKLHSI